MGKGGEKSGDRAKDEMAFGSDYQLHSFDRCSYFRVHSGEVPPREKKRGLLINFVKRLSSHPSSQRTARRKRLWWEQHIREREEERRCV